MPEKGWYRMEEGLMVNATHFLLMRFIAVIIIFIGNYIFLQNVFQSEATSYLFVFSLPISCIGALLLTVTYLAINQKYLAYANLSFLLLVIATIVYFIESIETTSLIAEYIIYIFITIALLIDIGIIIFSESELAENRVLLTIIIGFLGLIIFYFFFIDPYLEVVFVNPSASLFQIYAAQSIFDDPNFNWTSFYLSIAGIVFMAIVIIAMPLYAYYKYGIKVWKPSEWGSLSWRDMVPFARRN